MFPDSNRHTGMLDDSDLKAGSQPLLSGALEAVNQARRYDPARLGQALATYIRLLVREGQYEQASTHANEILRLESKSGSVVEAMITLGICSANTNQLDEAELYFNQAAELSRKINYPIGVARALRYLAGMVLFIRGQFHVALTFMEEAGILLDEQGSKHWNEPFLRGLIYQTVGDRRHCREVLDELVLQIEPGTRLAAAYYLLWARLAIDEDELEQAKEYLRLGLRVANRVGVAELNLWIRLEYSRFYRIQNDASTARAWADDALNQSRQYGLLYFTGLALIERSLANQASGDAQAAEADLLDALRVLAQLRAGYDLARARYYLALLRRQTDHPGAEAAWLEAAQALTYQGYAFILEKEQDLAFPLVAAYVRSKNSEVRTATETLLRHLANVPPPPLRVISLGQFAVWKGRRRIADQAWNRRKAGELFRYLLLQPNRAAGREIIIEALWPENESGSPEDLLHQCTSALRHALEPDLPDKFPSRYLKVEGEHIALALPPGSSVDFEHFERALPLAMQSRALDRLQDALNLYSGELFPSDRYADWSSDRRQALAELHQRGLLATAEAYLERGQYFEVVNSCRQILHVDSWNEDAVLLAMKAYAGMQNTPQALLLYQRLEQTLQAELGIVPRSDLRALADQLRDR